MGRHFVLGASGCIGHCELRDLLCLHLLTRVVARQGGFVWSAVL
jgi:hypothetical protein